MTKPTWLRALLRALSLTVAGLAVLLPSASAGSYKVHVCKHGKGNAAMTAGSAPGFEPWGLIRVTNNCDGGWHGWNGISASVTNGPQDALGDVVVPVGTSANILTFAPPYAGIREIQVDHGRLASYYGNATGWNARVMVPSLNWCSTDGTGGTPCSFTRSGLAASNSGQNQWASPSYPGYSAQTIGPRHADVPSVAIGVVCNGGSTWDARPCYRAIDRPSAGVAIVSADIVVHDHAKPTISQLSGSVTESKWHRPGPIGYGVTAWDNTGIRAFTKHVNGQHVGTLEQACDYGQMRPCQDRQVADNSDTVTVSGYDGFHTVILRAWGAPYEGLNCDVDCADASTTVAVDGTAPGAPASTNPGPAWTRTNAFTLAAPLPASEADPDGAGPQARAPIVRRIVTICPAENAGGDASNCKVSDAAQASGLSAASAAITVPREGAWNARVQLVDAAGNVGALSAAVPVRLDVTPPVASVKQAPNGVTLASNDPLSGPAGFSYRIDGKGDWISGGGTPGNDAKELVLTVPAPAGQRNVEVRVVDHAGNWSQPQSFSVTVLDGTPNVTTLEDFSPSSQVAVVDRGEVNGVGGGERATLSAWFVRRGANAGSAPKTTVRTIGERTGTSIAGVLVDASGRGISGARIDLGAVIAGGRSEVQTGAATTDGAGAFSIKLPKGQTSRDLTVAYMARVGDTKPAAAAGLRLIVKARASFRAHDPRVGRVKFTGFVSSGYLTKQGVRVEVQWWNPRARQWQTFGAVRTNQQGRWVWRRDFTARGTYRMRAYVPSTPAYAYKGAASRTKTVRIR